MAVEGLKRIYEIPFVKPRVDIVRKQGQEHRQKKRESPRSEGTEKGKDSAEEEKSRKGIIDIKA